MFTRAIVRPPAANFAEALTTQQLGAPDYARALEQHAAYCEALEQSGLKLIRLEADERYPDSTFVEDTAVVLRAAAGQLGLGQVSPTRIMLTRPGAFSRTGEVESVAKVLSRFCLETPSIQEPGTLDGGDVCEADRDHFFIGISERTNTAGAQQLAVWLATNGCTSSLIDIRKVPNILHLKSGVTYLGDKRLAVIGALAQHIEFRQYQLVRLTVEEEYAANCLRVNDHVLVAAGHPVFEGLLRQLEYETIPLEMTEFQKMDGGLSCLSLRF